MIAELLIKEFAVQANKRNEGAVRIIQTDNGVDNAISVTYTRTLEQAQRDGLHRIKIMIRPSDQDASVFVYTDVAFSTDLIQISYAEPKLFELVWQAAWRLRHASNS